MEEHMFEKLQSNSLKFLFLLLFCLIVLFCNPGQMDYTEKVKVVQTSGKDYGNIEQLTQNTYRIDIKTITVDIDYYPSNFYVDCVANVVFSMYKNNTKPIIHLDPVIKDSILLKKLELNGENLDILNDWQIIDGIDSNQRAMEIQRNLDKGVDHTLKITYRKNLSVNYYMLSSQVSDFYGRSNENFFPTINRFGDMIRHFLRFKVHGDMLFRCIGSGYVQEIAENGFQEWTMDTEREVPSNTVMFVLAPENDTILKERKVDGIDVRIMAFKNDASIDEAFNILEPWLLELRNNLGPFPMPRGYSVFLMSDGGGMEYFGGTISSMWALAHETFHMYFGTSIVLASYRDSWLDEAINEWYEHSVQSDFYPISYNYSSNMVSGFSPVGLGFDSRAYDEGARIIEHIANTMGGRTAMIGFLKYLHRNYAFKPFTTMDFLNYLKDYSGLDYVDEFKQWLFSGENISSTTQVGSYVINKHMVNISPPPHILKKYPELQNGGR
jgi:hypothetical protein